jgi:hypothetical protein
MKQKLMNKSIISALIFSLITISLAAQVINAENKPVAEEPESGEATGTTTPKYQEYQSWSTDAMGGLFIPSAANLWYTSFGVFPRYNFIAPKDHLTVSVGSPLNLGFGFSGGSNGTYVQFMGDVPVTIDLNIGSRATPFDDSKFGAYLGGGLDYNYMYYQFDNIKANLHTFGPIIHGGFRWELNGRQTGFRISYLSGFSRTTEPTTNEAGTIIIDGEDVGGNKVFSISVIHGIN